MFLGPHCLAGLSYKAADRAAYDEALGMLLDPILLQDMTIQEYDRWTEVLWAILDRQISFRWDMTLPPRISSRPSGDSEAWSILQRLQGSKSESGPSIQSSQTAVKSVVEALHDALRKAKKLSVSRVEPAGH